MEGVERPIMKALEEEKEPEDRRDTKGRREKPRGLSQRIDEEHTDEYSNRTRKSNRIVRSDTNQASKFKLPKHETNESEGTVESHEIP
jgi:hypothetical protein